MSSVFSAPFMLAGEMTNCLLNLILDIHVMVSRQLSKKVSADQSQCFIVGSGIQGSPTGFFNPVMPTFLCNPLISKVIFGIQPRAHTFQTLILPHFDPECQASVKGNPHGGDMLF